MEEIAQQIIQAIHDLREVDGLEVHVTASIGVAIYPKDGSEGKDLLQHADQAMYEAKIGARTIAASTRHYNKKTSYGGEVFRLASTRCSMD